MTQAYALLLDNVNLIRKSWRIRRASEGVLLFLAIAVGVLTLAAGADQFADPNTPGRSVLFLIFWGSVAAAAARFVVQPLTVRHSDDFFAALIEQRHPKLQNRLINALQLGRQSSFGAPRLIEAIVADGAAAVDHVDPGAAVSGPALKQNAAALGIALAVAMVYFLLAGPAAVASAQRVLMPWADILPFTWTTLSVSPDQPVTLLEGSPLEIRAITGGRRPAADASLTLIDSQNHRRTVPMSLASKDEHLFSYMLPAVNAGFLFFVSAGDTHSRRISVVVEPRPRITKMSVVYHYPAYTALAERKVEDFDGHLHGLPQTRATLTLHANKPLEKLTLMLGDDNALPMKAGVDPTTWSGEVTLTANGVFYFKLLDRAGHQLDDPGRYTITLEQDTPPVVGFTKPGRDMQVKPEETIEFALVAQDDLGVGPVSLLGRITPTQGAPGEPRPIHQWPNNQPQPQRRAELALRKSVAELGLKTGDRMEYWATVEDRNNLSSDGPGRGESRRFNLLVLTPEQSQALLEKQLAEYAKALTELIRMQRLNRAQTASQMPARELINLQSLIRRGTQQLAELMQKNAFPGQSVITELQAVASEEMAQVVTLLESYRDAQTLEAGKAFAEKSLPVQDGIIAKLEDILKRINRDQVVRADLKRIAKTDQAAHNEVKATLGRLAKDLDQFLAEQRDLQEKYEKMAKRDNDASKGEDENALGDAQHRLDRWKQWAKDSVDGLAKLPEGFVKDSALAETLPAIFEETEKKQRGTTTEIATPAEEGMKVIAAKVLEDLEVWMMDHGDNVRWAMEEPLEGKFQPQPSPLSANLQDLIGDLVEDINEFDEGADDVTSSWGGDMPQGGWDITDGPMSTFSAQGKTGNQLPNAQEITGRSGAGRRGRSSGQMVGDESNALEGRPTPARVTNERYEEGQPKASKQLDPRGATGGGKKTGGGLPGLQGGSKPDFVKDMQRLADNQAMLRERTQQVARQLENAGRPSSHVNRALQLLEGSEQDLRDLRYDDAARKRKTAINELKAEKSQIDEAVNVSLQKAQNLPPELRQQISAGAQQALPEGYEDLVGAYYKALSGTTESTAPANPK